MLALTQGLPACLDIKKTPSQGVSALDFVTSVDPGDSLQGQVSALPAERHDSDCETGNQVRTFGGPHAGETLSLEIFLGH